MNEKALYCVIDIKSFYASCECVARQLDIFETPLAVVDPERGDNTVVMSVTPYLKKNYHVSNVSRRKDLPNLPNLILAQPRMAYYIDISSRVVSIFLDFVSEEDLHVYSIDESFLNVGPYLRLAKQTPEEFVASIQKRIHDELGLIATAGIAPNMFLAKVALDNEGKKKSPYIAHWSMADVETKLWAISPITEIWGIAEGTSSHLRRIGIDSLETLAKADDYLLKREFGIMGKQLKDLANGIDRSDIRQKYVPEETSLSLGQSLWEDYDIKQAELLLREMSDELCQRLRKVRKQTGLVDLYIGYANPYGGFAKQMSLDLSTDDNQILFEALYHLYIENVFDAPIRRIGIAFGHLASIQQRQYSLFDDIQAIEKRRRLNEAMDYLNALYGKNTCLRATSLCPKSTIKLRHSQIGGHKA